MIVFSSSIEYPVFLPHEPGLFLTVICCWHCFFTLLACFWDTVFFKLAYFCNGSSTLLSLLSKLVCI